MRERPRGPSTEEVLVDEGIDEAWDSAKKTEARAHIAGPVQLVLDPGPVIVWGQVSLRRGWLGASLSGGHVMRIVKHPRC